MAMVPSLQDKKHNREATQLHLYQHEGETSNASSLTDDRNDAGRQPEPEEGHWKLLRRSITTFWGRQVVGTVPHDACRDHFALERTFLGYLRTSLALSIVSVIVAQLFRLQHTENPNDTLGFYVLGIPLACIWVITAIIVLLLGAFRFWRQQNAILRGKVHAGGWEINAVGIIVFLVTLTMFILHIAVDSRKDLEGNS